MKTAEQLTDRIEMRLDFLREHRRELQERQLDWVGAVTAETGTRVNATRNLMIDIIALERSIAELEGLLK